MTFHEGATLFLFITVVLLWFFRDPQFITGWSELIEDVYCLFNPISSNKQQSTTFWFTVTWTMLLQPLPLSCYFLLSQPNPISGVLEITEVKSRRVQSVSHYYFGHLSRLKISARPNTGLEILEIPLTAMWLNDRQRTRETIRSSSQLAVCPGSTSMGHRPVVGRRIRLVWCIRSIWPVPLVGRAAYRLERLASVRYHAHHLHNDSYGHWSGL